MRLEFLGTAGFHPSETRHTSGLFLPDAGEGDAFLIDAGTGTFRLIGRDHAAWHAALARSAAAPPQEPLS